MSSFVSYKGIVEDRIVGFVVFPPDTTRGQATCFLSSGIIAGIPLAPGYEVHRVLATAGLMMAAVEGVEFGDLLFLRESDGKAT